MTAVPRRGRDLPGEVLGADALACRVVRHTVSGSSIPKTAEERLSFLRKSFAPGFRPHRNLARAEEASRKQTPIGVALANAPPNGGCFATRHSDLATTRMMGLHLARRPI